jgi:hypothetical protein
MTMYKRSAKRFLVVSYTNHATDQFIEDLQKVGIPNCDMVRLGSKSSASTFPLLLSNQGKLGPRTKAASDRILALKLEQSVNRAELQKAFYSLLHFSPSFKDFQEHLEFSEDGKLYHTAFQIRKSKDGWTQIGGKGKSTKPNYLFSLWSQGKGPGMFKHDISQEVRAVWAVPLQQRQALLSRWESEIYQNLLQEIKELVDMSNTLEDNLNVLFRQGQVATLLSKRVIACTTTAAAKYVNPIQAAKPDVVLVEEAGEIQESHILAAIPRTVTQLILIGDHKQLRPKCTNYSLSVEKGDGYDLNLSLFERLILQGCPCTTLQKQHRMHKDISFFPRTLTYPELQDGPGTLSRDPIQGLMDRVIFIDHEHPETFLEGVADMRDPNQNRTKQNEFEAKMCLRVVKYLAQQGYGTSDVVLLTPYLGQLRMLMDIMADENDPVLNDMDSAELIRAGLLTEAASKLNKGKLRVSTIGMFSVLFVGGSATPIS